MISIEQWRAKVGSFLPKPPSFNPPIVWVNFGEMRNRAKHRHVVFLFCVAYTLMLCGDVESNPGPAEGYEEIMNELKEQRKQNTEHFKSMSNDMSFLKLSVDKVSEELKEIKSQLDIQRQDIDRTLTRSVRAWRGSLIASVRWKRR